MAASAEGGKGRTQLESTTFNFGVENERTDAGRDCRNRLARPNSQVQPGTVKTSFSLFS